MATAPIKIDCDVPLPEGSGRGRPATYPFRDLNVGDSFVVPISKRAGISSVLGRYTPKRFITRKVSETEARVWRVA